MRKVAIAVVLLAAAGAVLPAGYFGQAAERTLWELVANLPSGYRMEVTDYRRGWFSSTARLEWRPSIGALSADASAGRSAALAAVATEDPAAEPMLPAPMAIDIEIAHGPVYFAVGPGVGLFNARGRVDPGNLDPAPAAGPPGGAEKRLELYVSSFSGRTVNSRLEAPAFEWETAAMALKIDGLLADSEWSGPGSRQRHQLALDRMELAIGPPEAGIRMEMSDASGRSEYPEGLGVGALLAPSQSVSTIGEIRVIGADGTVMRMTGLSLENVMARNDGGSYGGESDAAVGSIAFLGREFAPAEFRQAFGGLSEDTVARLMAGLGGGVFGMPPPSGENPLEPPAPLQQEQPAAAVPQLAADMRQALRSLMADGFFVDVDAVLAWRGEHDLKLVLRQAFDSARVPPAEDMGDPLAMLAGVDLALDIEIPVAAAQELLSQGAVSMALMQGLLRQNEEVYGLSILLQDSVLTINERSMPLSAMLPN